MNEKCKSTCQSSNVKSSVVNLTLLYIRSEVVIPAPIFIGINSSGNPAQKHWIPGQARNDK
jgi:hypothetical protein